MHRQKVIVISGSIAVGKTTMIEKLAKQMQNTSVIKEDAAKNPYIHDFYKDMKKWSFASRIPFLVEKINGYTQVDPGSEYILVDRSYDELHIFALHQFKLGNMDKRDFDTYSSLFHAVRNFLPQPDYMLFLHCPVEIAIQRIAERASPFEKEINRKYLEDLNESYSHWLSSCDTNKVLKIDTGNSYKINEIIGKITN